MMPESPARKLRLAPTVGLYALGFAVLAWPWLSGSVTIPWDAKSQSFPNLAFLARSLAQGQSPFWTPHIYAGWPQIADPQSLIFSQRRAFALLTRWCSRCSSSAASASS